jgi:hypothetical protein
MALADWEVYKADSSQTFVVETSSPIFGSGSFKFNRGGTAGQYENIRRLNTPRGFTSGRLRWQFKVTTQLLNNTYAGVAFQQSQANLTGASGTGYFACMQISNSASSHRLQVRRISAGLPTTSMLFESTSAFTLNLNTTIALEIQWVLDIATLGGIRFNMKRGTLTDYSDLADEAGIINQVSTTTVYQTSVGEGPASILGTTTQVDHLYDRIHCVPLAVGG